jgi:DNA-binding winged helix-turn-helix (wHTH) protein/tetratricopeptide (TPR) repeat protein
MEWRADIFAFGEFELDEGRFELRKSGAPVSLQPKPLSLLIYLVRNRVRLVSKDELLDEVWPNVVVSETALTSALRDVRRALGDKVTPPQLVETVRGRGYRFVAEVEERSASAGELASGQSQHDIDPTPGHFFVGRGPVLAQLADALRDVSVGSGRIVLLPGEAGIGKTRTAEVFSASARAGGVSVHSSWCDEGEGTPAYWPWVQILRALIGERDADRLRSEIGAGAADIAQIVPELRERWPDLPVPQTFEVKEARFRLFDSVLNFLKRAADREPFALILDDLHSADVPSLRLLDFIARGITESRILVVAAYRDVEVDRDHPLSETLAELVRHGGCERISLMGLSVEEVGDLVRGLTESDPHPSMVDAIMEKTDGNPFFITEMVRLFAGEDGHTWMQDASRLSLEIPPGVRDVIRGRLRRLSEACNEVLALASVMGRQLALDTIQAVAKIDAERLAREIGEAEKAGFVIRNPDGGVHFSHTITQETVYAEQSAESRVRLHREVGEALEHQHGTHLESHFAVLAHHFGEAALGGDTSKAVDYAKLAGDREMRLLAFEEAASHYGRALRILGARPADAAQQCDLLLARGEAWEKAGRRAKRKEAYLEAARIARELADGDRLVRAAIGFGRWIDIPGITDEPAVHLLEEALAALTPDDSATRIRVLERLASHLFSAGQLERADALIQEATERARRLGDPATVAFTLVAQAWILRGRSTPEERLPLATEALELAKKVEDHATASLAQTDRMRAMLELGDIEASDAEGEALARRVRDRRVLSMEHFVVGYRSMRALFEGKFDEAERLANEMFALARQVEDPGGTLNFTALLVFVRREQGRLQEFEAAIRGIAEQYPEAPSGAPLAFFYAELGRTAEARYEFNRIAANRFVDIPRGPLWSITMGLLTEVCAALEDDDLAQQLYELLCPYGRLDVVASVSVPSLGAVSRYLGLLSTTMGRWDDAANYFEDALEMNERMGARPMLARTQYDHGRMLLSRGKPRDRQRARELIRKALATTQELGMKSLEEKTAVLCEEAEAGARSPARSRSRPPTSGS